MKQALLAILICLPFFAKAQISKPEAITVSYFGEMITHPGIKIGLEYSLKKWAKDKSNGTIISKSWVLSPNLAYYYHKRYQSGLLFLPELTYSRQNEKGGQFGIGFGLGGLKTFIPNVYETNASGEVIKTKAGTGYFATNYFLTFGKDLSIQKQLPLAYFIKPQFLLAMPNFPSNLGYFFLELGLKYKLR